MLAILMAKRSKRQVAAFWQSTEKPCGAMDTITHSITQAGQSDRTDTFYQTDPSRQRTDHGNQQQCDQRMRPGEIREKGWKNGSQRDEQYCRQGMLDQFRKIMQAAVKMIIFFYAPQGQAQNSNRDKTVSFYQLRRAVTEQHTGQRDDA